MKGWPWLLAGGWRQHCHAGQFPPARALSDEVCDMFGWPFIVLLRPLPVTDLRLPPLKWPADQHPEKSRLYSARQVALDKVMATTKPMTPERAIAVDAYFDEIEQDIWKGTTP